MSDLRQKCTNSISAGAPPQTTLGGYSAPLPPLQEPYSPLSTHRASTSLQLTQFYFPTLACLDSAVKFPRWQHHAVF